MKKTSALYGICILVIAIAVALFAYDDKTDLLKVVWNDDVKQLKLLLDDDGLLVDREVLSNFPRNKTHILHYSIAEGSYKCANLLVAHGADLSALDAQGDTPIMVLLISNQLRMNERRQLFDSLLHVSDLKLANYDNETALHLACRYGYAREIKALLAAGADRGIEDATHQTPEEIARIRKEDQNGDDISSLFK